MRGTLLRPSLAALACTLILISSAQAANGERDESPARTRAKAHTELGTAYFRAGRMGIALDEANVAVSDDSSYAPAYNLLGLVHMYLREMDDARENFERGLRLAPNDPDISNNYGWLLCRTGHEQESFRYFMQAVKDPLYQTPTKPFYNAGVCALQLKDEAAAEDYFYKAVQADRNNGAALYRLAEMKYRRGDLAAARNLVGGARRVGPADPAVLWLGLRIERKLGDRRAEQDYAEELRHKFEGSAEYQAMLQGKFE